MTNVKLFVHCGSENSLDLTLTVLRARHGAKRSGARLDWPKSVGAEGDLTGEMEILGGFARFYICNKISYICHNGRCEQFPLLL